MCISSAPANFEGTSICLHATVHPESQRPIHVMVYENSVQNQSEGPNAMLLHLPTAVPLTKKNLLDTSQCPSLLADMREAVWPPQRSVESFSLGGGFLAQMGIYEVIGGPVSAIPDLLRSVSPHKRPEISEELLAFYEKKLPGHDLLLACFDNKEAAKSTPIAVWYEPQNPEHLHFPTLDAHDGRAPNLISEVITDHRLYVSYPRLKSGMKVAYGDTIPEELAPFLPTHVVGTELRTNFMNGDFVFAQTETPAPDERELVGRRTYT